MAFKHLRLAGGHGMLFKISIAFGSGADQGLSKIFRMTKMGYLTKLI